MKSHAWGDSQHACGNPCRCWQQCSGPTMSPTGLSTKRTGPLSTANIPWLLSAQVCALRMSVEGTQSSNPITLGSTTPKTTGTRYAAGQAPNCLHATMWVVGAIAAVATHCATGNVCLSLASQAAKSQPVAKRMGKLEHVSAASQVKVTTVRAFDSVCGDGSPPPW